MGRLADFAFPQNRAVFDYRPMKRVITKHALAGGSDALLFRLLVGEDLIHQLGLFGQLAGEAGTDIHVQHQRSAVALLGALRSRTMILLFQ